MTALDLTSPLISEGTGARRSVVLLTGFLGSGKTTLLRRELDRAGDRAPAVVVNDFGATPVDDGLLARDGREPVVLTGGCACCTRREDLAGALAALLDDEQRGRAPRRDVVIETSGLSDPGPIAFTLTNDPVLKHHYALDRVCVTVDALTGLASLERHPVALRQLLAADDLIVTKADLAPEATVDDVVGRLRELNPSASVGVAAAGEVRRVVRPRSGDPRETTPHRLAPVPTAHDVATVELATDAPLDWEAFAVWLSLLVHRHGPHVLRVKAALDIRDVGSVVVQGVQHVVHRPEHVAGEPSGSSRVVLIVQGLDPRALERSFRAFVGTG